MNFSQHWQLEGKHAILGASQHAWINYSEDKMTERYLNMKSVERGTELHALAAQLIKNRVKLEKKKLTLNMYVNDAIGFGMSPEVLLRYSDIAFGTADAILYDERKKMLRIHDLKTGKTPASMDQLHIYMAFFCGEYRLKPDEIKSELRIYQNDEIKVDIPDPEEIQRIMDQADRFTKLIQKMEE